MEKLKGHVSVKNESKKVQLSPIPSKKEPNKKTKMQKKPFPKESTRNAMGEYLPKETGKVLTQQAAPLPGAADYYPDISKTRRIAPQYSITGRPKDLNKANGTPAPNFYRTEIDLVWKKRSFPMSGKENMKDHRSWMLGPACYLPKGKEIGNAPKWTLGGRTKVVAGPPSLGVQPVDSNGFITPAANQYRPKTWNTSKNITMGLPLKPKNPSGPGPADYDYEQKANGPAFTLAKRIPKIESDHISPGPASYNIDTCIGKSISKSILKRYKEHTGSWTPGPNIYNLSTYYREGPKYSLGFVPFERTTSPRPNPATYTPQECNISKQPVFSFNSKTRPGYPDILHYPDYSLMQNEKVGPGSYSMKNDDKKIKRETPAYSIGKRIKEKAETGPGPASYDVHKNTIKGAGKMGHRYEEKEVSIGPGPAAYYPKLKWQHKGCSIGARNGNEATLKTPAPNSYQIKTGQTCRGTSNGPKFTFKGRPSPFVYSGFNRVIFD